MKRFLSFFAIVMAILVCAASCAGNKKYETFKNDPLDTKIYTLDNGLKVYMTVNKEEPRIQTYIAVKVGGKNDPSETTGLAHYFEHLMFKGTESFGTSDYDAEKPMLDSIEALFEVYRKTSDEAQRAAIYHQIDSISYEASKIAIPNEYDKLMAVIGADGTNAWTSSDETVYTEDIPSNQIDSWARIQADRFRNTVIRGFHTELETIYEEKNMSLTQDRRLVYEAMDKLLFPNHPYGRQTVLGTQEHLKNPSITNVRKYHDTYYVPNNIAICLSGDFDPDEMVDTIEKYFGDWEPNPSVPQLQYEPEQPIIEPKTAEVVGLEAENIALGWRLPGASNLKTSAVAQVAAEILSNGMAGLMDLDLVQQQKVLSAYAYADIMPDYGSIAVSARPKEGQSLDELRDLVLGEFDRLRSGDFDESMIQAVLNNMKLARMHQLEKNRSRAVQYVNAFISGLDWNDASTELDRIEKVTKDDIVSFANEYLGAQSYVMVYKRRGVPQNIQKIAAPAITPIVTNRDKQSDFLKEIQATRVKPVEPAYPDFKKEIVRVELVPQADLLYKSNDVNDIAYFLYNFNTGSQDDPLLSLAFDYLEHLGTADMTAQQLASKMYALACSFNFRTYSNETSVTISGLSENIPQAVSLLNDLLTGAQGDENILTALKSDLLKARGDSKLSQRSCFSALNKYIMYGADYVKATSATEEQIAAVTSDELIAKVRNLFGTTTEYLYYGPRKARQVEKFVRTLVPEGTVLSEVGKTYPQTLLTESSSVVMAPFDANQIYYLQYSDRGEKFNSESSPEIALYNEYFGGGMNTIVFQEMREARGLAYSAYATLEEPEYLSGDYNFIAFIATQNDKMQTAIEAFDEIINDMPQSEAAFSIAKEALISRLRTQRTTGIAVLNSYLACRELGLDEPMEKEIFEKVQDMTLEDVAATQQKWIKDRNYTYAILGRVEDLDTDYLSTLGQVKIVSLEDIFGY